MESITIFIGIKWGMACTAAIVAVSSPIWLDWWSPGTHNAMFLGLFCPNHMPLPHFAFLLPLLKQAPSVYTSVVSCLWLAPLDTSCCAGILDILSGSAKTQKHSVRSFLHVIVGSKRISPLFSLAAWFWSFLDGVSDKFPWLLSWYMGFSLGNICCGKIGFFFFRKAFY